MLDKYRYESFRSDQFCDPSDPSPCPDKSIVVPTDWTQDSLFQIGTRLKATEEETGHYAGGPVTHSGAVCPHCQNGLSHILDFDLSREDVPIVVRRTFSHLNRLPIYYCALCPPGTQYRVLSDDVIEPLLSTHPGYDYRNDISEETPFRHVGGLIETPRSSISLDPIPEGIARATLDAWNNRCLIRPKPETDQMKSAFEWWGVKGVLDLPKSQFAGVPVFPQGYWSTCCNNPQCPLAYHETLVKLESGEDEERSRRQSFVYATYEVVPALQETWRAIRAEICWCCLAISVGYECC